MNTMSDEKKELEHYSFPLRILKRLYRLIEVDNYSEHVKVKKELVKEGEKILPYMHELLRSDSRLIRKEAIKIVELISHKSSIPMAIEMLGDHVSEIRWIAAMALIRIGRASIRPLLEALVSSSKSYFLRQGAHHILSKLVVEDDPKELKQLVRILRHDSEIPESIPVKAAHVLDNASF
jgi:HEAT repeat protein